jgi:hemerythrin-like domain-containing protein
MLPAGPLMIEHRLIERMVAVLEAERKRMDRTNEIDPDFLLNAADFFRTYADHCHHGKEEDILFVELGGKKLEKEHQRIMEELTEEHITARNNVRLLTATSERYAVVDAAAAGEILEIVQTLVLLYPSHIEKEDKHFFIPIMEYFSRKEQMDMLHRFWEFDEKLIHRVYGDVVEKFELNLL